MQECIEPTTTLQRPWLITVHTDSRVLVLVLRDQDQDFEDQDQDQDFEAQDQDQDFESQDQDQDFKKRTRAHSRPRPWSRGQQDWFSVSFICII